MVRDRLYEAAGYASPQEWAQACIGPRWIALFPASKRKEIHAEMRAEGKSLRAIANQTGVNHVTVKNDVDGVVELSTTDTVTGTNGRQFKAAKAPVVDSDRRPSGRNWGAGANTQIHKVLASLASFVTGVESLIDGVNADADATEAELQTIDEAIKALRQLRKKLTT